MSKETLQNWKGTAVVMGVDWGDSGKGRLIDDLADNADIVARYNGGSNTGHTVENEYGKFALHVMPSGVFHENTQCLIGRNVAVDLESLVSEMDTLDAAGIKYDKLLIDYRASLTMPWHKIRDGLREQLRGNNKVGTTGKGVGPTYADRTERVGLVVEDLLSDDFASKLSEEIVIQKKLYGLELNDKGIQKQYIGLKERVKMFIGDTAEVLNGAKKANKNILFEGAQGYFLDIDAGTYPYVTSSNPGVLGIHRSFDISRVDLDEVIGITKAYTTRVGAGPMPTKIQGEDAAFIIKKGNEIGTTTGRVRDPGWLDLVLINEANKANKITALAVTKLDVLSGLKTVKLCNAYKLNGKDVEYKPHDATFLDQISPSYVEFPGWEEDISQCRKRSELPLNAQRYLDAIEKITSIPIKFIGVGPKRGEVIYD